MTKTILMMLLLHHGADYTLQGWLADGKQKSWWDKVFGGSTPFKYRTDYKCALLCHSMYWALVVFAPIWWSAPRGTVLIVLGVNTVLHYIVDDLRANEKVICLWTDQVFHWLQILVTAAICL